VLLCPDHPVNRTQDRLDAAIIAYREAPSCTTRAVLFEAMEDHRDQFFREQTTEFQDRTHSHPFRSPVG
jgi:hypothetical protein